MENDAALYRDQTISLSLTLTVLVLLTPRRSAHFPLNFVLVTDMTTSDIYLSTTWSYAEGRVSRAGSGCSPTLLAYPLLSPNSGNRWLPQEVGDSGCIRHAFALLFTDKKQMRRVLWVS